MKKITIALLVAGLFGSVASAQAGMISYTASVAMTTTNWGPTNISLSKFDTTLGTLTSIDFDLSGTVEGIGKAESEDGAASEVTLDLGSKITLRRPNNLTLVVSNPVFSQTFQFTAYDGVLDYAGTSGGSTGLQSSTDSVSFTSFNGADFALFSGPGSIILNLGAVGASAGNGAGNLSTKFQTSARGDAKVTYNYTSNAVPEPATLGIMGLGLGALGLVRRRRPTNAA